jgi:hypothetical protein
MGGASTDRIDWNGLSWPGDGQRSVWVDAEQMFAAPELMELKLFQMACADMVILNKPNLVTAASELVA